MVMKKLRLLVTSKCNKNCEGCCNKDWDLMSLPICEDYTPYDIIMITGGEPMLNLARTIKVAMEIRENNPMVSIFVYTADMKPHWGMMELLMQVIDGITLTIHTQMDASYFLKYHYHIRNMIRTDRHSMRLNIFSGIDLFPLESSVNEYAMRHVWRMKENIEWIKNCPLPEEEVFMRYKELF